MHSQPPPSIAQLNHIAHALQHTGWCVVDDFLPRSVAHVLAQHVAQLPDEALHRAGVGRASRHQQLDSLRRDSIAWLNEAQTPDDLWLSAMNLLKQHLNQHLYLGLNDYEAHYARYQSGAFYGRHLDAFKGVANRMVSTVYYLNPDWPDDGQAPSPQHLDAGGQLLLYPNEQASVAAARITPVLGRLVVFLSEDLPHEVLPANRIRHSIAGWFRCRQAGNLDL